MSVGKSRIDELSVNSDFDAVLQILRSMSNELNEICVNQTRTGFNKQQIADKLEEIDSYIVKNPVIEKGRIEGSEDVKKIIDLLNQEVSSRLKNIELNIKESDRVGFEDLEKDFKKNKTNTMQKSLEEFEKRSIEVKTVDERNTDAEEVIKNRTERIEKAKAYKDVVKELCDKDSTLDEPKVQALLLKEIPDVSTILTTVEKREKTVSKIKEPNEYKDIFSKICKQVQKAKYDSKALSKKDLNEMLNGLKELKNLKAGSIDLGFLLLEFDAKITKETKNGVETIKSIDDADGLMNFLSQDKFQDLDWKDVIAETKEFYTEKNKEDAKKLVDYKIFKLYPNKVKTWKEGLKAGVRAEDILAEISDIAKDEIKLKKQVNSLSKDSKDMNKLELDKLKAEKRRDTYKDLSKRQKTTTAKLFGQDVELKNNRGEIVDFARVEDGSVGDVVEGLYDKVRQDGNTEEIDRQYNSALPVEYRQAKGWFSNIRYKIKTYGIFPWKWGEKTLADQRKEDWVKNQIEKQIDDIKEDASGDKSWTLTPEQEKAFNERQKDVVDKAKKKAREDLVKKGKTAKNANKDAQTEYKKLQREDDEDFTL